MALWLQLKGLTLVVLTQRKDNVEQKVARPIWPSTREVKRLQINRGILLKLEKKTRFFISTFVGNAEIPTST